MITKIEVFHVAGTTFDGRQAIIQKLKGDEPITLALEPENPYDSNAIAIWVRDRSGDLYRVGYVPRKLSEQLAKIYRESEISAKLLQVTGGFETRFQGAAYFGLVVEIRYSTNEGDQ